MNDLEELSRQRRRMFEEMRHASKRELRVHDRAFPAWVKREMRARRFVCFLVESKDGTVAGGGSLWLREAHPFPGFPGGRVPYLMSMYTYPGFRKKGIATMVVKRAVAWSRSHGYSTVTLHASRMGEPLYRKLGWKKRNEMSLKL